MPTRRRSILTAVVAGGSVALLTSQPVGAQEFPSRPIRIVVPFAAGGATDIMARLVADGLSKSLSQAVVVENKPGANGSIGSSEVARSAPDGYTLLMVTAGTHAINKSLYASLPYDPVRDFVAVAQVAVAPNILVVNPAVPAKTVAELIALAKAKPGQLFYGSAGSGSTIHLSAELFKSMTGIDIVHTPYRGSAPAVTDLVGGQIQIMFESASSIIPHIQDGRLRALGVTGNTRIAALPDVPTIAEAGVAGYEATAWFGLVAPAGTPKSIVDRLNTATNEVLGQSTTREQLAKLGSTPVIATPDAFAQHISREIEKWGAVVRSSGARVD